MALPRQPGSGSAAAAAAPPPQYTSAQAGSSSRFAASGGASSSDRDTAPSDDFFDIVPQSDQTSFQVGYLGLDGFNAWVKGDVLLKLEEGMQAKRHLFRRCSIALCATEKDEEQAITLFSATQVLWENTQAPKTMHNPANASTQSAAATRPVYASELPGTLPFAIALTNDLPHCIHLPNSSLRYSLTATLESPDSNVLASVIRTTPVHLTRYSRPGPLQDIDSITNGKKGSTLYGAEFSLEPHVWSIDRPTPMFVQLQRTIFRRAEPICVNVRIPPPADRKLLSIGLRSIEANLLRIVVNRRTGARHELLLAHSGKLCRLHSSRAIVLRLQLHPPFDASNMPYPHPDHDAAQGGPIHGRGGGGGCESISQETLLHDVSFVVGIRIAIRGDDGDRRDILLDRTVTILPGAAGVEQAEEAGEKSRVEPTTITKFLSGKQSQIGRSAYGGTSAGPSTPAISAFVTSEEEYDGYEDVGRPLTLSDDEEDTADDLLLREDGPPPTLLESRNDLQVEIDVEGVGAGVLRSTDHLPPDLPGDYTWREDELEPHDTIEDGSQTPPPPPESPPAAFAQHQRGSTFEPVARGRPGYIDDGNSTTSHVEDHDFAVALDSDDGTPETLAAARRPPPYMADALRVPRSTRRVPPFRTSSLANNDGGSAGNAGDTRRQHGSGTVGADGSDANVGEEEPHPPAYAHPPPAHFAASQHPPSYEA